MVASEAGRVNALSRVTERPSVHARGDYLLRTSPKSESWSMSDLELNDMISRNLVGILGAKVDDSFYSAEPTGSHGRMGDRSSFTKY